MKNDECVAESECGCYYEGGIVIQDGAAYVNDDCTVICTCSDNYLSCNFNYACSPHAGCTVRDGVRQCYCNAVYVGEGETCNFRDCFDAYQAGYRENGVYTILPSLWPSNLAFEVYCDMNTDDGGWTVFQRRTDKETDFYRNWESYKSGFGSFDEGRDFWLGNEKLHYLTQQNNTLLVYMTSSQGSIYTATYNSFQIGNEDENYMLSPYLGTKVGNAGDGMSSAKGMPFSTYDRDNLGCGSLGNVEQRGRGGWWYSKEECSNCQSANDECYFACDYDTDCYQGCSNLNGKHGHHDFSDRVFWIHHCKIKSVEMKIRPNIDMK